MDRKLNIDLLKTKLLSEGGDIAERLKISKETVSRWLSGDEFPRPDKLPTFLLFSA